MSLFQSNNNSSLFGQNTGGGGSGLFGNNNNNSSGGNVSGNSGGLFGTPMFGAKQNTGGSGSGLFGSSGGGGGGLFSSPNKGLGGGGNNMSGGLGGFGSVGTMQVKYEPQKNKEGLYIQSITTHNECRNKALDELRAEDYALMKAGKIPDDVKARLEQNYKNQSSGGGLGGLLGNSTGGGGGLLGSSNTGGGGGLFGGNNQSSGGGLFGNSNQGGGGGGGLFGSNNKSSAGGLPNLSLQRGNVIPGSSGNSGGGLFGNTNQSSGGGGGLFGQNKTGGGGGGLFGNSSSSGGGGGLFGNQNTQGGGGGGGGLFGNQSNTGGGGLFGNKTGGNTGGGLFSSGNTGQGGGLFGNTSGGGGGLFGNKTGGNTGGGLFSQSGGGGGLFSGQGQQGGGGGGLFSGGQGQSGGLFGNKGGSLIGNNNGGMQQGANPQLFGGYQGDVHKALLANIDPSWYPKLIEAMPGLGLAPTPATGTTENKETNATTEKKDFEGLYVPYRPQEINLEKKDQGYRGKKTLNEMAMSLDNVLSLNQKDRLDYTGTNAPYNPFEKIGTTKVQDNEKNIIDTLSLRRRLGPHSIVKRMNDGQVYDKNASFIDNHLEIMLRPKATNRSFYGEGSSRSSRSVLDDLNDSRLSSSSKKKSIYNNSVLVELGISMGGRNEEASILIRIYSGCKILDLKKKALDKLKESGKLVGIDSPAEMEDLVKRSNVISDCRLLSDTDTLIMAGITQDNNRAFLYVDVGHHIPKLTKEDYYTIPPIDELTEMNKDQIRRVEGFTIGNRWGKIEFLGETDLAGIDLDDLVDIHHGSAEVYPESRYPTEASKPPRGQKLNKPAIITLYECNRKKQSSKTKSRDSRVKEDDQDYELLGYNKESGDFKIKVQHFTKYTFDVDDSDEEDKPEELPSTVDGLYSHVRTPGQDQSQDYSRKVIPKKQGMEILDGQRDQVDGEGSESGGFKRMLEEKGQEGTAMNEEEMFESSDEEQKSPSEQFRDRHQGMQKKKILRPNEGGGIIIENQEEEDEINDFEEEPPKGDVREQGDVEEKFDEETGFSQSRLTELLSIADGFSAHSRDRLQATNMVKDMSRAVKERCGRALNCLELLNKRVMEKSDKLINVREKQFYMNRSFRVGWTRNGLATVGVGRTISVHKVVIHRELGVSVEEENYDFNYERYKRNLSFVSKMLYEPLLKALVNNSANMDGMEDLSLNESRNKSGASFLKFPDVQGLTSALIEFVEVVSNKQILREDSDESMINVFGILRLRDVEILSLLNTLFGKCEIDLWKYAIDVEKNKTTEEAKDEMMKKLERISEGERYNLFTRKHGLSKWLEMKSVSAVNADLRLRQAQGLKTLSEEILLYLSGRQIKRATEFCIDNGLNRLAVLLSTLTTNHAIKDAIRRQLVEWENDKQSDYLLLKRVYQYLSGDTSVIELSDWVRFFGTDLWYLSKPNMPVSEIVQLFYQEKVKRNGSSYETVLSKENPFPRQDRFDLGFLMLALYADHPDFNLEEFLSPYNYTQDCTDVKFLWLITEFLSNNRLLGQKQPTSGFSMLLESSKDPKKRIEFRYRVLRGFCYQMELLGLPDYAVYAVLIASPDVISENNKWRFVRDILQRNYKDVEILSSEARSKSGGIKKKGKRKELLVEILGVKQNLLYEAKAYKYLYSFGYSKAVKNLIKCGLYRNAHAVLCQYLAPISICNSIAHGEDTEDTQEVLASLESYVQKLDANKQAIVNWEKEGDVLYKYLVEYGRKDQIVDNLSVDQLIALANRIDYFGKTQRSAYGKIMIDKIRKDIISILIRRMSIDVFSVQKTKILDNIEKLDQGIKEDKTGLVLQFIEKDACC